MTQGLMEVPTWSFVALRKELITSPRLSPILAKATESTVRTTVTRNNFIVQNRSILFFFKVEVDLHVGLVWASPTEPFLYNLLNNSMNQ